MVNVIYPYGRKSALMIDRTPNIQVCHHPESDHIIAQGIKGKRWVNCGNMTFHNAAIAFAKRLSPELIRGNKLRLLVRDEAHLNIPEADITVEVDFLYTAKPTFPERNALDYQDPKDREREKQKDASDNLGEQ
jgi:hypothetical protein